MIIYDTWHTIKKIMLSQIWYHNTHRTRKTVDFLDPTERGEGEREIVSMCYSDLLQSIMQ
jgi:hypothetical protein